MLSPESQQFASSRVADLEAQDFIRITDPDLFQLFGDLAALVGQSIRFRFAAKMVLFIRSGSVETKPAVSDGYVAAGGPGHTGPTDTVGLGSLMGFEE